MEREHLEEILKHKSLHLRRSDVARNLGLPVSTLKFYTQEGLFKVSGTTEGGMTLYDLQEVANRYNEIERLKKEGKSLAEIKEILSLIQV